MGKALEIWPLDVIEEALGADAERVLPHALRTAELRVRFRAIMASAHADELSAVIPGFAAALAWPEDDSVQLPC